MKRLIGLVTLALVSACGGSSYGGGGNMGTPTATNTISITGFTFEPANLTVAPGSVVTVKNMDSTQTPHSVTSQSAQGQYVLGGVSGIQFDTGQFTGTRTFTIPSTAAAGTVIPYFCTVHKAMMANAGQITVGGAASTTGDAGYIAPH